MATVTIQIPDFPFSAHFYPEILEDNIQYMRQHCPELTDEDPTEPHIQLLRTFSLSYHLNTVLLDLVANESFITTAKLRASHKALLALIDVQLRQSSPASADLLAQLSTTFNVAKTIVIAKSLFSTAETRAAQSVEYECLEDVSTEARTDQIGQCYSYKQATLGYTDHTAEAVTPTGTFTPDWTPLAGDAVYFGHPGILWSQLDILVNTAAVSLTGVWEYYDGNFEQTVPTLVTNLGGTLEFRLTGLLGALTRVGTIVRVRSALTGAFQDLTVAFTAGFNVITTSGADSFLGQSSPSTIATDYIVGSDWHEFADLVDGTSGLTVSGSVGYTFPKDITSSWSKTTVGSGVLGVEGYWIRYRVLTVGGGPVVPILLQARIDVGRQYLEFEVTQGRTKTDDPLGTSDGTASQVFLFTQYPVIDDDFITIVVDEAGVDQTYTRVDNFLNSVATDRHYTLEFDDDGGGVVTFGNGVNGRIPPAGVNNISAVYRTMTEVDGNVGAQTITVNRAGIAYLATVTNPQGASGFDPREGSTDEDLARLKIAGPATLRTRDRAVSAGDVEIVAKAFQAADGSSPVKRALAIEESFGPKTVECVVVGTGGLQVDASKLEDIEDYFNGTEEVGGKLVMNHELTATNFTPRAIDVTMTLTEGTVAAVTTALTILLNPLALKVDGTYQWRFGGLVTLAKLYQVIMDTDVEPGNVVVSVPATDITLGTRELPIKGVITINGQVY